MNENDGMPEVERTFFEMTATGIRNGSSAHVISKMLSNVGLTFRCRRFLQDTSDLCVGGGSECVVRGRLRDQRKPSENGRTSSDSNSKSPSSSSFWINPVFEILRGVRRADLTKGTGVPPRFRRSGVCMIVGVTLVLESINFNGNENRFVSFCLNPPPSVLIGLNPNPDDFLLTFLGLE